MGQQIGSDDRFVRDGVLVFAGSVFFLRFDCTEALSHALLTLDDSELTSDGLIVTNYLNICSNLPRLDSL